MAKGQKRLQYYGRRDHARNKRNNFSYNAALDLAGHYPERLRRVPHDRTHVPFLDSLRERQCEL